MRILGHLDRFGPPVGGGVVTTVAILRELARRGHQVRIVTNRDATATVPEIQICKATRTHELHEAYQWADLVVPHMTTTPQVLSLARETGKPIVYPTYDDGQLELYELAPDDIALAIFCSSGLQERTAWPGRQLVVYPPIFVREHRVETLGDAITIPSLSPEKGGELFWKLVERMPERRFIGVIGGWGQQIVPDQIPGNVEILGHQGGDLRSIFRLTRLLLVPSQRLEEGSRYWTENWGRAAVEAACSGIPVIANPAPGPVEALGEAGIFCDRNDVEAWVAAIEELDNPGTYQWHSDVVRTRAQKLEEIVEQQLNALEFELQRMARSPQPQPSVSLDHTGDGWSDL